MIRTVLFYYWQLILLKETPENTPYSPLLMGISGFVFAMVMIIQWEFSHIESSQDFALMLMIAGSLVLSFVTYTYAVLFFKSLNARFVQTVTALFFIHAMIHVFAMPLLGLDPYLAQANLKSPLLLFIGVLYLFITLGLSVWQFVVTAHVYRYALNISAIQSVLAAFGLLAVNILTISFWR